MTTKEKCLQIHNFYLVGKDTYESGVNSDTISLPEKLPITDPPKFKFRETIQEIGLEIKTNHTKYKYYADSETIVVFEPFHFKDFDVENLHLWSYFELLFHQWYLFGISFNTNKIEIYEQLVNYLNKIYGSHIKIPDQGNSRRIVAWFSQSSLNSIYLEIDRKVNGEDCLTLTFYDGFLHSSLNKPINVYSLLRNELYNPEKQILVKPSNLNIEKKMKFDGDSQPEKIEKSYSSVKAYLEKNLSGEISKAESENLSDYIVENISPKRINLEIGDLLINIAVRIQEWGFYEEAEKIYNLIVSWQKRPEFTPSKETIELVATAYKNLINVYCDGHKTEDALKSFKICVKILKDSLLYLNNYLYSIISGQANYNVSIVYNHLNKYDLAIQYSQKALDHLEPLVSPWITKSEITSIILCMNNLGNYYSNVGNYKSAISNFSMGMRFAIDHKRYLDSSVINMNLANTYVKLQKYEEAEEQYRLILDLIYKNSELYKHSDLKGQVLINFADMYKATQNIQKEKDCLSEAILFYEYSLYEQPQMEELLNNLKKRILNLQTG